MSRTLPCLLSGLCACVLLSACGHRATSTPPGQPYIRIEPSKKTPDSALTVQQGLGEKELGIAFYPGAKVNKSGLVEGPKGKIAGAELQTTEPYARVVGFYRSRYAAKHPQERRARQAGETTAILNWRDDGGNCTVVIKRLEARKCTVVTLARTSR